MKQTKLRTYDIISDIPYIIFQVYDFTHTDGNGDGFGDVVYNIAEGAGLDHIVTGTPVDLCVGNTNNNDNVNILDVRLLLGYLDDPAEYPLNCGC